MKVRHVRKSAEFAEILRNCTKVKERGITVFFRKSFSPGKLSVGIIIPKKTEPLAVTRNYMRRVIYSVCGEREQDFNTKTEVIVRVNERSGHKGRKKLYSELKEQLKKALERVKTLK